MTRFCFAFLSILAVASAFTTPLARPTITGTRLSMFSAEDGEASAAKSKGLSEVAPGESADALKEGTSLESAMASTSDTGAAATDQAFGGPQPKEMMTVKNRNTGELMEVEVNESFLANESMEMAPWAWIGFVALPFILLTNDVFHYLPADTVLKSIIKY